MHNFKTTLYPLLLSCPLTLLFLSIGCGSEGDDDELGDETGGGADPETVENPCCTDPGDDSYWCGCYVPGTSGWHWQTYGDPQLCVSEAAAATYCADYCNVVPNALEWHLTHIMCAYHWDPNTPNCSAWDPDAEVTFNSGTNTYYLEFAFVAGIFSDPDSVMYCDDALVLKLDGVDGFKIANADSGELLYELGLRDDDIIVSINSMHLDNYADVVDAVNALWHGGESTYTLEIERNSSTVYLNYQVLFTQ